MTSLHWQGWPKAPAPVLAILRSRRRGEAVVVVDDAGRPVRVGALRLSVELLRLGWFKLLDAGLALLAACIVPRRPPPLERPVDRRDRPIVIVLPVLPDLSHTFVYREVLALRRRHPDWRVVALEHNAAAPLHAEAAALLPDATFLHRDGITGHALRVLRWLLTARGRALFALYRGEPGGSAADLLGKNPLRHARHPGNAFALADQLRPLRPRALHVYGSTWSANVAMGASMLLSVPFSITSYVDFEFAYAHKLLAAKVARARFFRVCTAYCAERMRALLPASTTPVPVIYFGLDLPNWNQPAPLAGAGVLMTAARLVEKKGLHLVPPALARLAAAGLPFTWRIAGDGPERARLQTLVAEHRLGDRVVFLGACDNGAVRRELAAADAALLPCILAADGERDGIPIFLSEAMALGVPVVTTPVSGIPELVRDRDTGFFAAPGDSDALAATLAAVLGDPALARRVGARGRAEVQRAHDVEQSAAALSALIDAT